MNLEELALSLFIDFAITVFLYLIVPVVYCIKNKPLSKKKIKRIITINAICVCVLFLIIKISLGGDAKVTGAVFLWSWVGYKMMKKKLCASNDTETQEEIISTGNNLDQENTNDNPSDIININIDSVDNENLQSKSLIENNLSSSKEEKIMAIITSKRIAAVISIVLCAVLYLSFLSAFTTQRDTYICYTTKTGECFHSMTCKCINTAYETTVYEACHEYKPCKYCNPCVEKYETTITDRNYFIPASICLPISVVVFLILSYKKKSTKP